MLRQYVAAKTAEPDALLLFRMGDFYELFFDDAKVAAEVLDLTLTARDKGPNPVPMAGVPHHAVEGYIARLIARGHRVAICEQMQDPRQAKGLVERAITRVVTPATVSELGALPSDEAALLAAAVAIGSGPSAAYALAALDMLTGELLMTVAAEADVVAQCVGLGVRELLCPPELAARVQRACLDGEAALSVLDLDAAAVAAGDGSAHHGAWAGSAAAGAEAAARAKTSYDLNVAPPHARIALQASLKAVVAYAERTQRRGVPHSKAPKWFAGAHRLGMDVATRRHLELFESACDGPLRGSLFAHLNRTRTPMGARTLRRWLSFPSRQSEVIERRQAAVALLVSARAEREALREALRPVRDIARLAGRVGLGRALPRDLLQLGASLRALREVQAALAPFAGEPATALRAVAGSPLPTAVGDQLGRLLHEECSNAVGEGGVFAAGNDAHYDELTTLGDNAEQWLVEHEASLRREHGIASLKVRYNRVFGYYVELPRAQAARAPHDFVRKQTTANHERFATAALEQFAVRAAEAREKRGAREIQLYAELIAQLTFQLPALQHAAVVVGQIDALQALAEVADRHRYCRPTLSQTPVLDLHEARHPVLECLMPRGESFVANDVALGDGGRRVVVLTGPNMAGKSTLMRQSALCVVLAQMGSFVPCTRATVGVCDHLFLRVGASDNLGRGQSTFMVEMVETAAILRGATRHSLVVLDEVGRGTATYDGLAIAWAVAEHLHDAIGARTLFATHYHELCALAERLPHVVNQHLAVHEQAGQVAFLRTLRDGPATRSYGVHVARLAKMPQSVLQRAAALLRELERHGHIGAPPAEGAAGPGGLGPAAAPSPSSRDSDAAPARPHRVEALTPAAAASERHAGAPPLALQLALARLHPDEMTPRQALAALYELKAAAANAAAVPPAPPSAGNR